MGDELRAAARFAGLHAALLVAIWLAGVVVYALGFAAERSVVWLAIDVALVAGAVELVRRNWRALGIALDPRWLAGLVVIALAVVTVSHAIIDDANAAWLDESNYLRTVREGFVRHGFAPFNMRWLAPSLAGVLNVLPVDDAVALKAVNFGAFVVAAVYLALLVVRMGTCRYHAIAVPVFLFCSYLGVYGAFNRLVLDPFNYATFVVLAHTLVRRAHWRYFPIVLLIASFNSEKAIYWIPIFAMMALVDGPVTWRRILEIVWLTLRYAAPAVVYLIAISLYIRGSQTEGGPMFFQNLHVMALTWLAPKITNATVAGNNFQMLWFPFGAFTVYALLGFARAPRAVKPFALLLIPIMLQALIAHDTQRMVAYAFIVYLPFGFLYLSRALRDMPRMLSIPLFAIMILVAIAQYYVLPMKPHIPINFAKLVLATTEIVLTFTLIFLHHTFFAIARD